MSDEELLARHAVQALRTAASVLGESPERLAKRLQDGEIARLIQLLNAALPHISTAGLRHRTDDLLSAVTDGRMPMFERPESELDWAMKTLRRRRDGVPDPAGADDAVDDAAEDGATESPGDAVAD